MKKTAVEGTILALDYGLARIGVAVGNTLTQSARPLVILHAVKREDRWQQLSALFEEWNPVAFVVGVPLHGDGSESEHTLRCRRCARQLGGRFRRHVFEVDERYSSVVVESGREKIDDRSAALLLQQFSTNPPRSPKRVFSCVISSAVSVFCSSRSTFSF